MNLINVKEAFQQHIFDVFIVLSIVYVGALSFSAAIRWIQPRLKKYGTTYENVGLEVGSLDTPQKILCDQWNRNRLIRGLVDHESSDSESTGEDNICITEDVKSAFDAANLLKIYTKKNYQIHDTLVDKLALGIENAIYLRTLLRNCLISSEAQTNITISPEALIDSNSWPKFTLSQPASDTPYQISISSENVELAESCEDEEYWPIFRHLGCCDILKRKNHYSDKRFDEQTSQKIVDRQYAAFTHPDNADGNGPDYTESAANENKILKLALNEFMKELKPIRDQIKELKDCMVISDESKRVSNFNLSSDTCSSYSEVTKQSDLLSEPSSTTFSSNLQYNVTSSFTVTEDHYATVSKDNLKCNKLESISLLEPFKIRIKSAKPSQANYVSDDEIDIGQDKKHSPLAEMYIKLSRKSRAFRERSERKNMTCHINLSVNLNSTSVTSLEYTPSVKDRNIISPLFSEP